MSAERWGGKGSRGEAGPREPGGQGIGMVVGVVSGGAGRKWYVRGAIAPVVMLMIALLVGLSLPPTAQAEQGNIVRSRACIVMPVVSAHPSRVLMREPFSLTLRVAAHCTHKVTPLHLGIVVAIGGEVDAQERRELARSLGAMAAELEALPEPRLRVGVAVPGMEREIFCPINANLRRAATCLKRADAVQGFRDGALTAAARAGVRLFAQIPEPAEDETEAREILLLLDAPGAEGERRGAGRSVNGRSERDCADAEHVAGVLARRGILRIVMRATRAARADTVVWRGCPYHLATSGRYFSVKTVALNRVLSGVLTGEYGVTGRALRQLVLRLNTSEWIDVRSVSGAERLPPTTSGALNLRVKDIDGEAREITVVMRARIPGRHAVARPLALAWVEPHGGRRERTEPPGASGAGTVLVLGARYLPTATPQRSHDGRQGSFGGLNEAGQLGGGLKELALHKLRVGPAAIDARAVERGRRRGEEK